MRREPIRCLKIPSALIPGHVRDSRGAVAAQLHSEVLLRRQECTRDDDWSLHLLRISVRGEASPLTLLAERSGEDAIRSAHSSVHVHSLQIYQSCAAVRLGKLCSACVGLTSAALARECCSCKLSCLGSSIENLSCASMGMAGSMQCRGDAAAADPGPH